MVRRNQIPDEITESLPNDNPASQEAFDNIGEMLGGLKAPPPPTDLGPPAIQPIGDTYSSSLDDAASLLLRQLDPSVRDYAFELADLTLKIPRWQLVLGAVLAQFESGSLQAPSISPSWARVEVVSGLSICKHCRKMFTPQRYGQLYCSNLCGNLFRKGEIAAINKQKEDERKLRKRMEDAQIRGEVA